MGVTLRTTAFGGRRNWRRNWRALVAGVLVGLGTPLTGLAQKTASPPATTTTAPAAARPDPQYEQGKTLLAAGKYALAMNALQKLLITNVARPTPTTNAATYLWAVAALRSDNARNARDAEPVLRRLRADQSGWIGTPDVILLQAQLAEALGERERARTILGELPAGQLTAEKDALLSRLGFGPRAVEPTGPVRVAALLPLGLDDVDPRRAQFGQELYAGLKLAADSLRGLGTVVDLRAYDLDNDTVAARTLLAQPDLRAVDLIVGPVYKAPSRLVARAAADRQTPVINPLSEDGTLLDESPTLYLFRPSVQTQARAAAALTYARFEPKTAVLLVEETKDDAAFAAAFRAEFEKLGGRITVEEKVSSQLYRTRMTEKVNALPLDSLTTGALVVVSKEKNAAQQVAGRMERDNRRLPVVAPAAWLDMPELSLDQFTDKEFYFIAPTYRDVASPANRQFRRSWQTRYGVPPSDYARAGFELLFTFAPLARPGGSGLAAKLNQRGVQPGPLSPALGYPNGARDNQGVTVLRLINRLLEEVK